MIVRIGIYVALTLVFGCGLIKASANKIPIEMKVIVGLMIAIFIVYVFLYLNVLRKVKNCDFKIEKVKLIEIYKRPGKNNNYGIKYSYTDANGYEKKEIKR